MANNKPAKKQFLSFLIETDLLARIDDYRFDNRFPTRVGAIKFLLAWALDQNPEPPRQ